MSPQPVEDLPRDRTVDILRGLAIGLMVGGHMGLAIYAPKGPGQAGVFGGRPPLWGEALTGMAPPLFLLLSGMMAAYGVGRSKPFWRALRRGLGLISLGALIDLVIWRIVPFTTVDVLYIIGLSAPVAHLAARASPLASGCAGATVLGATPLLQAALGYADYPTEYFLDGRRTAQIRNQTSILNHWLVDGWFPIFPWLGFSLLGVALGARRLRRPQRGRREAGLWAACGGALLVVGLTVWWPRRYKRLAMRAGTGGAFMPPGLGYMLSSMGVITLLFPLVDGWASAVFYWPLAVLGRDALLIYPLQFPIVRGLVWAVGTNLALGTTLFVLVVLMTALVLVAFAFRAAVSRWRRARADGSLGPDG